MVHTSVSPNLLKFFKKDYENHYNYLKEAILAYERVIDCKSKGLSYNTKDLSFFPSVKYLDNETVESLEYTKISFSLMVECYETVGSFEIAPEKYTGKERVIVEGLQEKQKELYKRTKGYRYEEKEKRNIIGT